MAHTDRESWDDEERFYSSSRDSDDSPILHNRHTGHRRYAYSPARAQERGERRSTLSLLVKFFSFCFAMILLCVLMYIPVYNRANEQIPKGTVAGWPIHTNRDTKLYVQPNNDTTIHQPSDVCPKSARHLKNKLFLLIVVCSSTVHFDRRVAIRETWANYKQYLHMSKIYNTVRDKYKNYNFTYDLYPESQVNVSLNVSEKRVRRDISGFSQLLPELAKALQSNLVNLKTDSVPEEKRFEDDDDPMLPEFDMNKELGDEDENDYNYDYESNNIMRIPPKGYEDSPALGKLLKRLKDSKVFPEKVKPAEEEKYDGTEPEYKVVFLLGLPGQNNDTEVQNKIEEEVERYGDVIQEGFIDSYNNLTLKSIMMLKWITNNCNESVRYILKTDDDMYINVPNLMQNLRNRSRAFDAGVAGVAGAGAGVGAGEGAGGPPRREYLLIGDLICGARPVLDATNKWYSPRYMFSGRVYPRYLSGTGYVLSAAAARALYAAALTTTYFHLEDIYITGMCALRAHPRVVARDDPGFTYQAGGGGVGGGGVGGGGGGGGRVWCAAHAHVTAHRVPPRRMRQLHRYLAHPHRADVCERKRLTQVRHDRLRPKTTPKKLTKLGRSMTK